MIAADHDQKENVRIRRSAVLTAVAASAREWNGEPATAAAAPPAGAAKTGFAPAPPSMPGDERSIRSPEPLRFYLIYLVACYPPTYSLPRTQSPDDRSKLQLA